MANARQYQDAMQTRLGFLRQQWTLLQQQRQEFDADVQRLSQLLERTRAELVGYLLPEVDDEELTALQERLSYPGLLPIKRQTDARLAEVEQRRAQLGATEQVQHNEHLVSKVTDELAEIAEAHARLQQELKPWHNSQWFHRLYRSKYFAEDYEPDLVGWLRDWRSVSFLMSDLEQAGLPEFDDSIAVRKRYQALRGQADPVMQLHTDLTRRKEQLLAAKAEYDQLGQAPGLLVAELYQQLGRAILDHLYSCPDDVRTRLAAGDHHLAMFLRKEAGLGKQVQYLRELAVTRVDQRRDDLQQQIAKLERKTARLAGKIMRGRAPYYSDDDVARMLALKQDKWERRQAKLRKLRQRVGGFDRYDRGSFLQDYLWWDLITNRARADDIYEVRIFRQQHPTWDHRQYVGPGRQSDSLGERVADEVMDQAAVALAHDMLSDRESPDGDWADDGS